MKLPWLLERSTGMHPGVPADALGLSMDEPSLLVSRDGCGSAVRGGAHTWTARTAAVAHRDRRAEEGNRAFSRPHRRGQEGSQDRAPQAVLTFLAQSSAASGADWLASLGVEPSPFRSKEHTAARESSPWKALGRHFGHCPHVALRHSATQRSPCPSMDRRGSLADRLDDSCLGGWDGPSFR